MARVYPKTSKKRFCLICTCLFVCALFFAIYHFIENTKADLIIIKVDGGICSQISFLGLGYALSQKGYKVKYDLSWFREYGKDVDGIFARNYDMQRAFPNLEFEEATDKEIKLYSKKYRRRTDNTEKFSPPIYIDGYPERYPYLLKYRNLFIDNFKPVGLHNVKDIFDKIKNCNNPCAVHVRRGDIAKNYISDYGFPCSVNYFLKAIRIISSLCNSPKFFFFSDEPGWIKNNIVPKLDRNVEYYICEKNGSDAGYLDLYLISHCKHFIASKGSFGVFGRILSKSNGYFIAPINKTKVAGFFDNCIFLSDQKTESVEKNN